LLVVSADNTYLFPSELCERNGVDIVNCHSALLPAHPGSNAAMWAVYEGDAEGGVTWHFVDAGIDSGDVIAQGRMAIGPDDTAFSLTAAYQKLALEVFADIAPLLLDGRAPRRPQEATADRIVRKSRELPQDGIFSLDDDASRISRLLRAMDYDAAGRNVPKARTVIEGCAYEVLSYEVRREGFPVDLAVGQQREFLDTDIFARDHEVRKPLAEKEGDLLAVRVTGVEQIDLLLRRVV
jgi:methionyl-tRNA formyltransferase